MNITDNGTMQGFIFASTIVLISFIICMCIVGFRLAEAFGERLGSKVGVEKEIANAAASKRYQAEAEVKKAETEYQTALLQRVGQMPPVQINIPQAEVDKLAMGYIKRRIEALKIDIQL